jgi:hypothetical protein
MKKLAILSTVVLIGLGSVATTEAEAQNRRRGGAIAAGVIGGLAAGALIGAASNAYAAPAYGYGYGSSPYGYGYAPAYGYGYAPATRVVQSYGYAPAYQEVYVPRRTVRSTRVVRRAAPGYRTTRVVQSYAAPAYRTTRVVRSYDPYASSYYGGPGVSVGVGFGSPGFGYWR